MYKDEYNRFSLNLTELKSSDERILSLGNVAAIAVQTDGLKSEAEISTNHPFEWRELEFHFGLKSGFSPEVLLTDPEGNVLFRSFVRVANRMQNGTNQHRDFIIVAGNNLRLDIEVKPDPIESYIIYQITATQDSVQLYTGSITSRDTVAFSDYKITVPRLRQWCYIDVVKSPYLNLVFFGFWSALAGLSLSFISRLKRTRAA